MPTLKITVAQLASTLQFVSEIAQVSLTQNDAFLVHAIGEVFGNNFPVAVTVGNPLGHYTQRTVLVIIGRDDLRAFYPAGVDGAVLMGGHFVSRCSEKEWVFSLGAPYQDPGWGSPFHQMMPPPYGYPQFIPAAPAMQQNYHSIHPIHPWTKQQPQPFNQGSGQRFGDTEDVLQEREFARRLFLGNKREND